MSSLFDLSGRVAVVAGGAGYLGRPICKALAEHGAAVIVADINPDAAKDTADALPGNSRAESRQLDAGDESSINKLFESIKQPDILINLALFSHGKSLEDATAQQWDEGLRVTLTGANLLSRAAAQRMPSRGGSIVHFSSMYGMVSPDPRAYEGLGPVNPPDYGAAKAGVLQLARYQAVFWAKQKIRVNTIVPGPFPNTQGHGSNAEFIERLNDRVPMGRVGRADEITGAVIYLSSDASSFVTGTSLVVDGGWTAW